MNCPSEGKGPDSKLCYNCGESGHSLDKCPKPLRDGWQLFPLRIPFGSECLILFAMLRVVFSSGDNITPKPCSSFKR